MSKLIRPGWGFNFIKNIYLLRYPTIFRPSSVIDGRIDSPSGGGGRGSLLYILKLKFLHHPRLGFFGPREDCGYTNI